MAEPDYPSVLHLSDPAYTATLLARAAEGTGRRWRVLPLATTPPARGTAQQVLRKAARGLGWFLPRLACGVEPWGCPDAMAVTQVDVTGQGSGQ